MTAPPYEYPTRTMSWRSSSRIWLTTSWTWVVRSTSGLARWNSFAESSQARREYLVTASGESTADSSPPVGATPTTVDKHERCHESKAFHGLSQTAAQGHPVSAIGGRPESERFLGCWPGKNTRMPMKYSFEFPVGTVEKHRVSFDWGQWFGLATIRVDGAVVDHERHIYGTSVTRNYEVKVGASENAFHSHRKDPQAISRWIP